MTNLNPCDVRERTVEVACPKCGHKSAESVARLKMDGYICPACGDTRDAAQFARAIKQVEDAVEKLKRELARLKKIVEGG